MIIREVSMLVPVPLSLAFTPCRLGDRGRTPRIVDGDRRIDWLIDLLAGCSERCFER